MNDNTVQHLLGSIGENNRRIKILLKEKTLKFHEVQDAMDRNARTKTPLNERQVQNFHEFAGLCAQEGGKLQHSLMGIDTTLKNGIAMDAEKNTEAVLIAIHKHQHKAIASLRRLIASSEMTLQLLFV